MNYPLGATQAAAELGCSVATLYRMWTAGTGPRSRKVGKLRLVFPEDMAAYKATLPTT